MPYSMQMRGNMFCVIKKSDNSVVKCHPTKQDAIKHMIALKMNVTDAGLRETADIKNDDISEKV